MKESISIPISKQDLKELFDFLDRPSWAGRSPSEGIRLNP